MTMDKISDAVLDKVKAESEAIIKEAEDKAKERLDKAGEQHSARYEEEKKKLLDEAESEAARIQAQTSITTRQELLKIKNEIIGRITEKVKKKLSETKNRDKLAVALIREAMSALDMSEYIAYVAPEDLEGVKKLIKEDPELSGRIKEVRQTDCSGGAIIEDVEGKLNIDNTFDTRLETLLPRIIPEIGKEIFGT